MSLQAGKHVTDNLRLVRLIGRGAMGSVWLADHLGLQSQVAVKFMSQSHLDDPVSVQRFRQEARAAAEIRSPHVVQVFDNGVTPDGLPFIVMELLDGESLDKRVKRIGPLSPWETASIVAQSCKGLAKAHERGILHRDIKPPNIFLIDAGGEPFVKVLDFGVAKFADEESMQMTAAGHMVGTPAYMGPEQLFHGKEIDHRGDLWSLAVVSYWALTGLRPFEGVTLGELCVAVKRGEFARPSTLRNDLPPDIDAFFGRAFHRDIEARFAHAKEFAQAFEAAVGVSSTMHSTPSGVAHLATYSGTALSSRPGPPPPKPRWPLWIGAATAGVLGFGLVAVVASHQSEAPIEAKEAPAAPRAPEPATTASESTGEGPAAAPAPSASAPEPARATAPVGTLPPGKSPSGRSSGKQPVGARKTGEQPPPPKDEREDKAAKTLGL